MNISSYYKKIFGEPEREAEFVTSDGNRVEIYKWNEEQTGEGVAMYTTLGASKVLGDSQSTCEFFIGLTPEVDNIVQALAEVALHGNGTDRVPNSGDTITLAYDLWPGTKARSFMFSDGDEVLPSTKSDGKEVHFIQLVPLYDSELQYKKEYGEGALWNKFESLQVPYWDSERNPSL